MKKKPVDVAHLKALGSKTTTYPQKADPSVLECFDNPNPDRDYYVEFETAEFTSLCPKTGQPDFGTLTINYVPDKRCIESKSLKLYLFSFRNEQTFMETVVNRILDDLVAVCDPREMTVTGDFRARGGISIRVTAEHFAPDED